MMSEKRFKVIKNFQPITFVNMANGKHYDCEEVVGLLNEQQATIEQLQEENKKLKNWKKRMIEHLSDWFNKTEYLSVLNKITEINNEIGFDIDE